MDEYDGWHGMGIQYLQHLISHWSSSEFIYRQPPCGMREKLEPQDIERAMAMGMVYVTARSGVHDSRPPRSEQTHSPAVSHPLLVRQLSWKVLGVSCHHVHSTR